MTREECLGPWPAWEELVLRGCTVRYALIPVDVCEEQIGR